ncbi:MAG: acyl-CoA desaturase [Bacteroidetes bacterium]|jgi:linoleoyl-CoA desaturase|nr:acyl-CoA desaturase [Bacteroidota bacterium]
MNPIRFVGKDKAEFTAALRKNVNDYFREKGISSKGNSKMLLKAVVMLACYLAPFILILTVSMSPWAIFPLSVAMGLGMSGIGMSVMHDAAHGSFSKKGWLNKLFTSTMYLIGGNPFNWRVQHNMLHHTYTNIDGHDEDIEPKGSLRLSKQSPLKKVHRFQHIYAFPLYCLMTISRVFSEFFRLVKYNKAGYTKQQGSTPKKEMVRLVLTKFAYLVLIIGLPMLFSGFSWWMILLGFLVMHAVAGILMSTVFQMAHLVEIAEQPLPDEQGTIHHEWMAHELQTTANFARNSRLFGWMIGGLNYQIEHHLFPSICHIHYPQLSPIVERTAREYGLPYHVNRTFFGAIGSHVRLLRSLGK